METSPTSMMQLLQQQLEAQMQMPEAQRTGVELQQALLSLLAERPASVTNVLEDKSHSKSLQAEEVRVLSCILPGRVPEDLKPEEKLTTGRPTASLSEARPVGSGAQEEVPLPAPWRVGPEEAIFFIVLVWNSNAVIPVFLL
ncbi:unnamed protein product [Polarella glacialis]|uniref:Uncharacterized protein n=1 Tax=Polarella glacialis TaxID=89957 RepID=A0A813DTH6_POLGL|nr:unnamed protein product [Polarella glacialis]